VVTSAAPHHLIADGAPVSVRATRGGDAWQAQHESPPAEPPGVLLGMPSLRQPAG
jgi:tRNA-2-methylthio-N6-dimethylallyladenosine synthase